MASLPTNRPMTTTDWTKSSGLIFLHLSGHVVTAHRLIPRFTRNFYWSHRHNSSLMPWRSHRREPGVTRSSRLDLTLEHFRTTLTTMKWTICHCFDVCSTSCRKRATSLDSAARGIPGLPLAPQTRVSTTWKQHLLRQRLLPNRCAQSCDPQLFAMSRRSERRPLSESLVFSHSYDT